MAASAADREVVSIPKIELHVHLGGAIAEATAAELARRHRAESTLAPALSDGRYPRRYRGFGHFLATLVAANRLVRTPEDLETVAAAFAREQVAQSVVYSEVIFTAMTYIRNGMAPAAMWRALRTGLAAAGQDARFGIIVDAIRDGGREEAEATVRLVEEAEATVRLVEEADAPIVGLCLTGVEGTVPTSDFVLMRQACDRLGLGLEVHAGETGPPAGIVEALDILGADRIGHGARAIEEPQLLERLVREAVPLDVCPSSNVGIGLFRSLQAHPFAAFWRAGITMTISSDDPPFFATTLTDELRHVVRIAGLTRGDLAELQRRAARVSFAPPELREGLVRLVDQWEAATVA